MVEIRAPHELTGAERVEARAFVVLDLELLEQLHPVTRRGRHVDPTGGVGEEQAGLRQLEELDGAGGEQGQEVDHVEVGDEGVGDVDECPGEQFRTWDHAPQRRQARRAALIAVQRRD